MLGAGDAPWQHEIDLTCSIMEDGNVEALGNSSSFCIDCIEGIKKWLLSVQTEGHIKTFVYK